MVDIATSKSTIDDLVGAVGNQTKQDDRQRKQEGRSRQKGEDNLFNWQKKESRKQSEAEKKNAKLQGIESHMGKINQMHNYRAAKSLKTADGKGVGGAMDNLKEKVKNFQERFAGFWERSLVHTKERVKKAKGAALKNLQQHADVTNIWGAMKTDSSIILGMVGAIGQIPGFQTFFTVAKVILSNLAIWTFQLVKFLTTGFWKLIWKAIKWVARSFASHADWGGAKKQAAWQEALAGASAKKKADAEASEKAGAGMFEWAGPLGTDKDPFYIMPSSMFGKQIPGGAPPKDAGGTKDKEGEEEEDKEERKKKGFFNRMMDRMTRKITGFVHSVTKPIRDMANIFRNLWKKILAPVLKYLRKAVVFLAKGLLKLGKFIIATLTPLVWKLIKTLILFVSTMVFMIAQLIVQIISGVVLLGIKIAALAVQLVLQVASTVLWIAMLMAANLRMTLIAVALGALIWFMWANWGYFESKFMEWGDRMKLLGDRIKLLWDTVGNALYVTIRALLWGTVSMLKKVILKLKMPMGIMPVGQLIWAGMPVSVKKGVSEWERSTGYGHDPNIGIRHKELERRQAEIDKRAAEYSWGSMKQGGEGYVPLNPTNYNATTVVNTGAKNTYVGNNKTPNPLVWDLNTNTLK